MMRPGRKPTRPELPPTTPSHSVPPRYCARSMVCGRSGDKRSHHAEQPPAIDPLGDRREGLVAASLARTRELLRPDLTAAPRRSRPDRRPSEVWLGRDFPPFLPPRAAARESLALAGPARRIVSAAPHSAAQYDEWASRQGAKRPQSS